jgi:hypothetical protein
MHHRAHLAVSCGSEQLDGMSGDTPFVSQALWPRADPNFDCLHEELSPCPYVTTKAIEDHQYLLLTSMFDLSTGQHSNIQRARETGLRHTPAECA